MREVLRSNLADTRDLVGWLLDDSAAQTAIVDMADAMVAALRGGGRILSCGNGGSMCDAMHFAEELTGRFHDARPPIAAQAISDPGHLSCVANDYGYEEVFARGVEAFGRPGDVLLAFSTSGNSANVLHAARRAREGQMVVCALLGRDGGQMKALCDHSLIVPTTSADRIQEIHIQVVHGLIEMIERQLHPENYG
jgi:D-sedoheptulose 7-phosphate isomerase